ncbi:hypothetical protein KCTC32516_00096 [Polaribacter huanghezhanensis]|uniref:hypothetical protein n=1 Tax=Polaribacter huanghezhanensis TaxID=1354726 RepID=UPI00264963E2|nr:hypothetical protein [Polaribacter huanghezhanensis]WKD84762.1 hypothetical protein KCTC32516_00096 [Polaribacter huanghezhanensis]
MRKKIAFLLILIITSCGYKGTDIEKFPNKILEFNDLPDEIKNIYLNQWKPNAWDTFEKNGYVINLDSINYDFKYNNTAITGVRPGAKIFTVNNKSFFLKRNSNKEQPPFILKNKNIYFQLSRNSNEMNLLNLTDLKKCVFKKYDISKAIKK